MSKITAAIRIFPGSISERKVLAFRSVCSIFFPCSDASRSRSCSFRHYSGVSATRRALPRPHTRGPPASPRPMFRPQNPLANDHPAPSAPTKPATKTRAFPRSGVTARHSESVSAITASRSALRPTVAGPRVDRSSPDVLTGARALSCHSGIERTESHCLVLRLEGSLRSALELQHRDR